MVVFAFDGEFLFIETYGLLASMAFWCMLFVTTFAKQLSLLGGVWLSMKLVITFGTAKVFLVPVFLHSLSELGRQDHLGTDEEEE